jgi:energy-converting hydrogenase B subunit D
MTLLAPLAAIGFGLAMIGAAFVALRSRTTPVAVLAAGLVSLSASVLFLILAAPDVAMTEAAIGSGLTTFLFFYVLGRIRREGYDDE